MEERKRKVAETEVWEKTRDTRINGERSEEQSDVESTTLHCLSTFPPNRVAQLPKRINKEEEEE